MARLEYETQMVVRRMYGQERRQRLIAVGLCISCGKELAIRTQRRDPCADRFREVKKASLKRARQRKELEEIRKEYGS